MSSKPPDKIFFANNRKTVMERLQGGLLVVAGYTGMQHTNDIEVPFVQEGCFWYLSGIEFPDWWLIVDAKRGKSWLVEPDISDKQKLFEESMRTEDAMERSGVDGVLSRDDAKLMLRQAADIHPLVYTVGYPDHHEYFKFVLNPAPKEIKEMLSRTFKNVQDFRLEISKLRAIKQPCEIDWIQDAVDLTIKAMRDVKSKLDSYHYDYQINADLTHTFLSAGAAGHSFDPIISVGEATATVHHFTKNNRLRKGQPLLMDIGVRLHGYTSDLTRTYALGKPSDKLVCMYDAVREIQRDCIKLLKPGLLAADYFTQTDEIIKKKFVELGLMKAGDEDMFRQLFPHSISHGLGIDVHDALGRPRIIEEGMVLMVEPGVYLPKEKFGVRIEDVILITKGGSKNLSAKLSADL